METVECYEVWVECDPSEAYAHTSDGKSLKMIAQIVNGVPIYLENKAILQNKKLTKEEADEIIIRSRKNNE